MPQASVIVPAYNGQATILETLKSLVAQTHQDFEIVVVDDGSTDETLAVVEQVQCPRLRLVRQANRGLAGAHNTGIAATDSPIIGFCDADDLWAPDKLERHLAHLEAESRVGISFSGSAFIDMAGHPIGLAQRPRLRDIDAAHVLKRNPIGNGSAPVMRREALESLRHRAPDPDDRDWWFDEEFRQSDDIEGWTRFAVLSEYRIEGIPGLLTRYRINLHGLSANTDVQYQTWERMLSKLATIAPDLVARHGPAARAYQLRYLLRRAVSARDGEAAAALLTRLVRGSTAPLWSEPVKTIGTLGAAALLATAGARVYAPLEALFLTARRARL